MAPFSPGVPWAPFTLRISFFHLRMEWRSCAAALSVRIGYQSKALYKLIDLMLLTNGEKDL